MSALRTPHRRVALWVACVVALVVASSGALQAGATDLSPLPTATSAASWLAAQLTAGTNQLSNNGQVDWGLTADAALALVAVNGPSDTAAGAAVTNLLAHIGSYTTFDDQGADLSGVLLAGPTAKSLLVAEAVGKGSDPVVVTLQNQLRSLLADTGRFTDLDPYGADTSNGFSQSDAILALARTTVGVPDSAVTYLLSQQCPNGGFRLLSADASCTDSSQADTDATAMAVQALFAVPRTSAVGHALSLAVGWLESVQDPTTGSFSGTGPTAAANTNSAGLIAEALRAAGAAAAADRAAAWVTTLQLTAPSSDAGAIAYDPAGFAAAAGGITDLALDQWHRATSQAVLADGVAPLGSIGVGGAPLPDPVTPTTPGTDPSTSSTTSVPGSTASTSSTTTSVPGGSTATTTTVVSGSGASTVPVQVEGASVQKVNFATALGSSRSSGLSSSSGSLALTGGDVSPFLALGIMAFLLGIATALAVKFGDWTA